MYAAYSILLALYDFLAPFFMQFSDATTMNLSLLTANFYSLGISILAFGQKPSWLYLVGFFCIPIAIIIFSLLGPKTPGKTPSSEAEELEEKQQDTAQELMTEEPSDSSGLANVRMEDE